MKKSKIDITIIKEEKGYSANTSSGDHFIATEGDTFEELKNNILEAVNLAFEEEKISYTFDEIKLNYDLQSFFEFYKIINAKALAERIDMNQSLLAQYIRGIKKPSASQTKRIIKGIHDIGIELSEVNILV